jgi:hypothetical protein
MKKPKRQPNQNKSGTLQLQLLKQRATQGRSCYRRRDRPRKRRAGLEAGWRENQSGELYYERENEARLRSGAGKTPCAPTGTERELKPRVEKIGPAVRVAGTCDGNFQREANPPVVDC